MGPGGISQRDRRVIALLGLSSLLVQLPFLDRGLSLIDEGSMLAIAEALADGDVLYRDRATFISPFMYEWTGLLLRVFGSHLLVGRLFQMLVFSGVVVLTYGILRVFVPLRWAAVCALSLSVLKPLALPLWTIPNYNQLGMLFALAALAATLQHLHRPGRGGLVWAGLAVGLTVVTKLSLGAAVGLATAAAVALDGGLRRAGALELLRNLAGLTAVACVPVALMFLYYASLGALDPLIDRSLLALVGVSSEMRVPLPSPAAWSGPGDVLFRLQYLYFPPPIFAWLGDQSPYDSWVGPALELGVKFLYFGPLLATALGGFAAIQEGRASRRESACGWLLVSAFSALAYLHTAHRLDFAHILSIAPAPLLVCSIVLRRWSDPWRSVPIAVLAVWLTAGAVATVAVYDVYDRPLETARGRLRASAQEVEDAAALLARLDAEPDESRVLLMRTLPLFYFLSGRPIPGSFDLFLPGYFRPGEDESFAGSVADLDLVLYNPNELFGVPKPITEFAPHTSRALADRFEIVQQLSPTALVLEPRAAGPEARRPVQEIAQNFQQVSSGARPGRVERTSWIVYPVVTTRLLEADTAVCFSYPHTARAGEVLFVRPMFEHLAWTRRHWPKAARRVLASVHVQVAGVARSLFVEERRAGLPGPPLEIPLSAWAGESLVLRFCASRLPTGPDSQGIASFGWADARILR
jgi:hypothetical protein